MHLIAWAANSICYNFATDTFHENSYKIDKPNFQTEFLWDSRPLAKVND